jgi:hypothetical protein
VHGFGARKLDAVALLNQAARGPLGYRVAAIATLSM